ncbi:MAG: GlsB/YeaQ/YmgE family stress response membrane protein [Armatimonadota bacterium]
MDLVWLAITGLVAGAIAKALMPGEKAEPKGCLMTMLLGIAGSVLFGLLAGLLFGWQTGANLLGRIVAGVVGAMIIIALLRRFTK